MSEPITLWTAILTNALFAGLCFWWTCIAIAAFLRRHRPLHLVGALFTSLLMIIFALRALLMADPPVVGEWSGNAVRLLWLAALLVALIYSVVYSIENRLLRRQ